MTSQMMDKNSSSSCLGWKVRCASDTGMMDEKCLSIGLGYSIVA